MNAQNNIEENYAQGLKKKTKQNRIGFFKLMPPMWHFGDVSPESF